MEEKKKRIQWLDVAKGICMLSVIAGHLDLPSVNRVVYSYHLTVFFILSGYTLKKDFSREGLNKRFKSLMLPYFTTCFAVMVMDIVNVILVKGKTNLLAITWRIGFDLLRSFVASGSITELGSIDLGGMIGAIWFLPAMFFAFMIAQALLRFQQNRGARYFVALSTAGVAAVSAEFVWLPFSIQSGLLAVPLLLFGYDLRESKALEKLRLKHVLICLALFVAGVLMKKSTIYYVTASMADILISPVCALASSLCIIWLSQKLEGCKPLAWVGRNSVYFLCAHLFELETMGTWLQRLLTMLELDNTPGNRFVLRVIFCSIVTALILLWKRMRSQGRTTRVSMECSQNQKMNLAKAVLIVLLLCGTFQTDDRFRKIICSIHMAGYVFLSGYCFQTEDGCNPKRYIWDLINSCVVPYCLFGVLYVLASNNGINLEFRDFLLGVSNTQNILADTNQVGLAGFILMLLIVRLIYFIIGRLTVSEIIKNILVLGISLTGQYLGEAGWWLPWSLDCAMYALIFFHLGYFFKKYRIMELICERSYSYFILSCIWAYMIYKGGMEITVRSYGTFGITILGAVSGTVLLYMLCYSLRFTGKEGAVRTAAWVGRNSVYIMAVHGALGELISNWVGKYLMPGHIYFAAAVIVLQLLLGVCAGSILETSRKVLYRTLKSKKSE